MTIKKRQRPRLPARRAKESLRAYRARVLALISGAPVSTAGRPSMVQLVFCAAHAALRAWTLHAAAPASQGQLLKATKKVLDALHTRAPRMSIMRGSWKVPSANTIRKHVRVFLCWRLGLSDEALCALPPDQYEALSRGAEPLPDELRDAMLRGYFGTQEAPSDKPMDLDTAMTRQIHAIPTLTRLTGSPQ